MGRIDYTKYGTKPIRYVMLHDRDRRRVSSLRRRNRAATTRLGVNRHPIQYDFLGGPKSIWYNDLNFYHNNVVFLLLSFHAHNCKRCNRFWDSISVQSRFLATFCSVLSRIKNVYIRPLLRKTWSKQAWLKLPYDQFWAKSDEARSHGRPRAERKR